MSDGFSLAGKVAVVTGGAGGGIGHGLSTVLAERGAAVLVADIDTARTEALVADLCRQGLRVQGCTTDVRSDESVRAMIDRAVGEFGGLDILVNSAGIGMIDQVDRYDAAAYENLLEINLKGVLRCCRYAVEPMRRRGGGSIVNISSVHAHATMPGYSFYAGTKAAVVGLTRGLAIDLGPEGIRVNSVLPGLVDCEQTRSVLARCIAGSADEYIRHYIAHNQALPVAITPRDVGYLVAFLASDASRTITGADLVIDGGSLDFLLPRQQAPIPPETEEYA